MMPYFPQKLKAPSVIIQDLSEYIYVERVEKLSSAGAKQPGGKHGTKAMASDGYG